MRCVVGTLLLFYVSVFLSVSQQSRVRGRACLRVTWPAELGPIRPVREATVDQWLQRPQAPIFTIYSELFQNGA